MSKSTVRARIGATDYLVDLEDDAGHAWSADEPVEAGGGGTAPTPYHMVLAGLGACTAITLRMYARRKQWPLETVDVELVLQPAGEAGGMTAITRRIQLGGALDEAQRERLLKVANGCPVHNLLVGPVEIDTALG